MSNVSEHFEALQAHLAQAQTRAERLGRLLASDLDESGRLSLFVLPEARALVSASLVRAADAAADLGIELYDTRWVALVTLLHNAGTFIATLRKREGVHLVALLGGLQVRAAQLRFKREMPVTVRLS